MNGHVHPRSVSHGNGFTLIEVLIALTVFAVGILAVATMQVGAIHGNALGNEVTQALALAQEQMEELKSANFDDLTTGTTHDPDNPIDETGATGGIYSRSWTVAANTTHSRMVTVTVSWAKRRVGNGSGAPNHTVTLTSVTRGGGY